MWVTLLLALLCLPCGWLAARLGLAAPPEMHQAPPPLRRLYISLV